ncbi:MAG TPA: extracellular solute-binding protein [Brachybacterium sp.]|nr:extracellular solute-binding protein [Brachybacterium sp.]
MLSRRSLLSSGPLAAAGALALSSCGSSSADGGGGSDGSLSWMSVFHTPATPDPHGAVMTALLDHTGIDVEFQWVPDANKEEKINSALASGSVADINGLNQLTMPSLRDALASGLFWDVEDYLGDYPNIAAIDPKILDGARLDGVLYGVPQQQPLARYGVLVRQDWLDELGLDTPHTLDELREVAQAFTEGDPTGTGQETVGIIDRAESFLWGFPELAGYFGAGAFFEESDDGTIIPSFMTDPFKEAMAWYRDIYANGWMNQEFATMQKQNQLQAIAQDKAGIVFTALFEAPGYIATATSIDPDNPAEWTLINDMTYRDVPRRIVSDTGGGMGGLMAFSTRSLTSEEDLRRGLSLIEALLDETSLDLMTNGIEGTHYEVDADGAVTITDRPLWEQEVQPFSGARPSQLYYSRSTDPYVNEANEKISENAEYAVVNPAQSLTSATYDSSWAVIEQSVQDAWNNYMVGQIDMGDFDAAIEAQRSQGLDDVIAEYTESYDASR